MPSEIIGAVGDIWGAIDQQHGIEAAANAQAGAANNNAVLDANATTAANTYTKGNLAATDASLAPYQQAGGVALGELGQGTAAGGAFNSQPTAEQVLAQDPGYQFQLDQGTLALQRAEAAGGGVGTGGALKAGVAYSQNYANTAYNNAYNQFMNTRQSNYANLENIANYGQTANAVGAQANTAAAGLVSGTTLQGTAAQTGALSASAAATAGGDLGVANSKAGEFQSLGDLGTSDIAKLASASGYP
jgi:hypothetical protein